jgi:uncharacterized phage protein gp47/JayE
MSGTTPSPTAAYVDASGIHAPTFLSIQNYLIAQFQAIYGDDIVVSNDSQDGQLIGIFAVAIADTNSACIAVYNSFSPSTGQGAGLSSMVKINGMQRLLPSNSSVDLVVTGQAGIIILNGAASDIASNLWLLPASVTIPVGGQITVTATAAQAGAITALPGDVSQIATPTFGWQSVINLSAAAVGAPVETDPELRVRQSNSTGLPSVSVLEGIIGAVMSLPGVQAVKAYENDTNTTDATTTLPPHSISLVVIGGDATQICQTILNHKTPGCYTFGTTRVSVADIYGLFHDIGFYVPTPVSIGVHITLTAKTGYTSVIGLAIQDTMAAYIAGLGSGVDVIYSKLWLPANLCDQTSGLPTNATGTYDITAMTIAAPVTGTYGTTNIHIPIFSMATLNSADVAITVH